MQQLWNRVSSNKTLDMANEGKPTSAIGKRLAMGKAGSLIGRAAFPTGHAGSAVGTPRPYLSR